MKTLKYKIHSGIEFNKEYPDTFEIPSDEEKTDIRIRDAVKLPFEEIKTGYCERMWVQVTKIDGDNLVGTLDNEPAMICCLKYKDIVNFHIDSVISITEIAQRL